MIFSWTFAVNDGAGDCVDRSRRQLMRRCGDIPQLPKDPATDSLLREELQRHKQNCSTHSDYELSKERFQQLREPRASCIDGAAAAVFSACAVTGV